MRDRKERELIKRIALALNLTQQQVIDVVESVPQFVRQVITKGDFEGVQVPYLGVFWVKLSRLEIIQKAAARFNKTKDPKRDKRHEHV
jgi:nucleoid DNA-binding protein